MVIWLKFGQWDVSATFEKCLYGWKYDFILFFLSSVYWNGGTVAEAGIAVLDNEVNLTIETMPSGS